MAQTAKKEVDHPMSNPPRSDQLPAGSRAQPRLPRPAANAGARAARDASGCPHRPSRTADRPGPPCSTEWPVSRERCFGSTSAGVRGRLVRKSTPISMRRSASSACRFCSRLGTTSRHSAFQARLLFDLDAADVERLGAARLADLQRLACKPFILECAFREWPWFWQGLFTAIRPELRRQLALMALQPRVADWPQRRPPQPTA